MSKLSSTLGSKTGLAQVLIIDLKVGLNAKTVLVITDLYFIILILRIIERDS